ncbi:hypothetical protein CKAH01_07332 [Colletotrichum kahawae]|uniref:Uncharacterized protein n=1 Tax=Colletotrichum kahawae TaxID=34407 RepID=A0AAE0D290_COLKA|nr:hypothetical protein CKAH01_07332 [Colletotrichum kahawae]
MDSALDSALAPAFLSALDGRQLSNFRSNFMYYFVETPANHKPLFREPRNFSQIKWHEWEDHYGGTHQDAPTKYIYALPSTGGS